MDLRKVKKLIELLEESNLNEMEIREGEESIRLSRGSPAVHHAPAVMHTMPVPDTHTHTQQSAAVRYAGQDDSDSAKASDIPGGHQVTSPMVGTYYSSPEPDAEPFVAVGSKVEAGDTLCVIEAMKIFNQIESDTSGTVVHIQKGSGEAVEYGELLFVIQ